MSTLAQFVAQQTWRVKARDVILWHHDDWLPGFSTATDTEPSRREIACRLPGARLTELGYLDAHPVFERNRNP